MKDIKSYLTQIKENSDYQYLEHIPVQFLSEKKLENFLKARFEEKNNTIFLNSKPYHLVIEPTNACNLGCPLCPTGLGESSRKKGVMKFDLFKKIIDETHETTLELFFQNWGEPTLVSNLPEMINYASERGIWTSLSTNFSRKYKNDFLKKLIESGLGLLHIDVDGTTQEVYEKYRKKGDLSLVLANTRKCVKIKQKQCIEYPIMEVCMLAMSHNEHQFEIFKKLAAGLGVDRFRIDRIQIDPNSERSKAWLPENKDYIYGTYQGEYQSKRCHWPWSGLVINWDGNVSACCIVDSPKADFGNIYEQNLMEVWNNESYVSSRAEFGDKKEIVKQTICNICKNKTHSKDLKRINDTFAITMD